MNNGVQRGRVAVLDKGVNDVDVRQVPAQTRVSSRYDQLSRRYIQQVTRGNAAHHVVTQPLLAHLGLGVRTEPNPERSGIDFCCGHGAFTRLMAQYLNGPLAGLDASKHLLEHARQVETGELLGITYHHADVHDPDLHVGTFDLAACCLALTDVDDLDAAMLTVVRHLVAGGIFAFGINHPDAPREDGHGGIWWPAHAYGEERLTRSPHRESVRHWVETWDRPLSRYLNAALDAGLELLATEDVAPPDYVIQRTPAMVQHPYMFVASWRKPNLAESATHTTPSELRRTFP